MGYAILFPGQGSQFVGMGAELFDARPDLLGEAADDALGWSLRDICLEGPEEELTRTDRAQPALYALAYAVWEVFSDRMTEPPVGLAGHSLGEYTALVAAGAIDYFAGLRLVAERGQAMAAAAAMEPSGMAALVGADMDEAEAVASKRRAEGGRLWVANINAPGQVVVAGGADDVAWLGDMAPDLGLRRVMPLKVAGAFHSPFMEPAAARLGRALDAIDFRPPAAPVWANATAQPHGADIATGLRDQLTAPVRFAESLQNMAQAGAETMIHLGPGDVTAGLARRSVPGTVTAAAEADADIDAVVALAIDSV